MIGIKNRSGKKLAARFDGKDYEFPADEKVVTPIHEDAARHIFGYGERDKTRALQRLGWLRSGGPEVIAEATAELNKFQFLAVEMTVKDETPAQLPRNLREDKGAPLSKEEEEHARKLADPKEGQQKFAKP